MCNHFDNFYEENYTTTIFSLPNKFFLQFSISLILEHSSSSSVTPFVTEASPNHNTIFTITVGPASHWQKES